MDPWKQKIKFKKGIAQTRRFFRASVSAFFVFLITSVSGASSPQGLNIQGRLTRPDGLGLESTSVEFRFQILSPGAEACVLYDETHTLNMSSTDGAFSIKLGAGNRTGTNFKDMSALAQVFDNSSGVISTLNCVAGSSYDPANGEARKLRVSFDDGSGVQTLTQDQTIQAVPYAMYADSLQGKTPSNFVQTIPSLEATPGTTQTRANQIFDTDWAGLTALLSGTSTLYAKAVPTGSVDYNNQRIVNVANPTGPQDAATKNYADTKIGGGTADSALSSLLVGDAGKALTWDGTKWVATATSTADATKLPLAGGTMTGAINMGAQNITNAGHVQLGLQKTLLLGRYDNTQETALVSTLLAADNGRVWFNTDASKQRLWNGTAAVDVGSSTLVVGTTAGTAMGADAIPNCTAAQKLQMSLGPTYSWTCVTDTATQWTTVGSDIYYGTGNVGIGTTTPSVPLEVNGNLLARRIASQDTIYVTNTINSSTAAKWIKVANLPPNSVTNGSFLDLTVYGGMPLTAEKYKMSIRMGSRSPFTAYVTRTEGSTVSLVHGSVQVYDTGSGYDVYLYYKGTNNIHLGAHITRSTYGSGGVTTLYPYEAATNTTPTGVVIFDSASASPQASIGLSGQTGIGVTTPTSWLHLKGGTATASTAPLKFTTGTNLTTPEDGAMEYSSSNLYFTIGSTRYAIPMGTAAGTISNAANITNTAGSITMTPMAGNSVIVNSATVSTSSTTGALLVGGGAGISGALNASGSISSGGSVSATNSVITPQVYGSSAASGTLKLDGTSDTTKGYVLLNSAGGNVGIGTTAPGNLLHVHSASTNRSDLTLTNNATGVTSSNGLNLFQLGTTGYIWNRESGNLHLGSNGATAQTITSAGNVGIGTTVPTNLLNLKPGARSGLLIDGEYNASRGLYLSAIADTASIGNRAEFGSGAWYARDTTASQMQLGSGNISFHTNSGLTSGSTFAPYERMRITSAGNVGIGTTTPSNKLDVAGSAAFGNLAGSTVSPSNSVAIGGYLGIGTASPSTLLHVVNTTAATAGGQEVLRLSSNAAAATIGSGPYLAFTSVSNVGIGKIAAVSEGSNAVGMALSPFNSSTFEAMRLSSNGNVGIGTTSPSHSLEISGSNSLAYTSSSSSYAEPSYGTSSLTGAKMRITNMYGSTTNSGSYLLLQPRISGVFQTAFVGAISNNGSPEYSPSIVFGRTTGVTAYAETMRIDKDGNVGIGTTSPASKLTVAGAIESTAGGVKFPDGSLQSSNAEMEVVQQEADGAAQVSCTPGSWIPRSLNTVVNNSITGASLSSNQITLPGGTYLVEGAALAFSTNVHQAVLYNVSNSSFDVLGTLARSTTGSGVTSDSLLMGKVTLVSATIFELRHRCEAAGGFTRASPGWGVASLAAVLKIRKIN